MPAAWQGTNRQGLQPQSEPTLHCYAEFQAAFCLTRHRCFWIRDKADAAGSRAAEPAGECPTRLTTAANAFPELPQPPVCDGRGTFLVTPGKPGPEAPQVQSPLSSARRTNSSQRAAAAGREHKGSRRRSWSEGHSRKFMFFFLVRMATH